MKALFKSPVKHRACVPLIIEMAPIKNPGSARQSGAALIAVIFVLTALAALGGLMTQLLTIGSEQTIDGWYSSQALYAAESGVEWSVYKGGASSTGEQVSANVWFDVSVTTTSFGGGKTLYTITSTGKAGGVSAANPRTQRQIVVQYMP